MKTILHIVTLVVVLIQCQVQCVKSQQNLDSEEEISTPDEPNFNDMLMTKINELTDLVRSMQTEMSYQSSEIKFVQTLIETCTGCQIENCANSNPCFEGVTCHDTTSGMVCDKCPRGYIGDGKNCARVEMCDENPCYQGVECQDTDHGAVCGDCPREYEGDGRMCTLRRNFCLDRPCGGGEQCIQSYESPFFECRPCAWGYTSHDGMECVDIDECQINSPCDAKVLCFNLSPGYSCEPCPSGFTGRNGSHVQGIRIGYFDEHANQVQRCFDVDECAEGIARCGRNMDCVNHEGSYDCVCKHGFAKSTNSSNECVPIPGMCPDGHTICDKNANCHLNGNMYGCKCKVGFAGDGFKCGGDRDLDGFPDRQLDCASLFCQQDNCPFVPNSGQEDSDSDGIGDVCDPDIDNDGILNSDDNCVFVYNPDQRDSDGPDKVGDACDNCPYIFNGDQSDTDDDGLGDKCDPDIDNDTILNEHDNCPFISNLDQADSDLDKIGDVCDNCQNIPNMKQSDVDDDLVGDACDTDLDRDSDGIQDNRDNCPDVPNADQTDSDGDGLGDMCDEDIDGDRIPNGHDNCPFVVNARQEDTVGNGIGDACRHDFDGDLVENVNDACPYNNRIIKTDFRKFQKVRLDPIGDNQKDPKWVIYNQGAEMVQTLNSDPGLSIGYDSFNGVDFEGTLFVDTDEDDDYIGFIFSYQSNKRFYAVAWKKNPQEYWDKTPFSAVAQPGIQIKLVDSATGPGEFLRNSLWHSGNTTDEVKLLWSDPKNVGWRQKTAYRWHLIHRPKIGLINMKIFNGKKLVADSGIIFDSTLKGGRLGMYVFSQEMTIWSNMAYRCNDKIPRRIYDRLSPQLQRECEVENYYNRMAAANRE